ncbi:MAG: dTMP kinase [Defluviitaleaceae bacterium]|nr:dTMP kinase [Defluviitaleaceae bacterium]
MSGFFITMEGVDGSGKSTQCRLLQEYLKKINKKSIHLREPGATPLGEMLREIIKNPIYNVNKITEAYLYATSRSELVEAVIKPALENGNIVICDRFLDSSIAYQGVARGIGTDIIREINKYAVSDICPNITFFIDIPIELSEKRLKIRNFESSQIKDRIELENKFFKEKVRDAYKNLSKENKRIVTIDGTKKIEEIHRNIISYLEFLNI